MKKIFYLFSVLAIALCFDGCIKDSETFVKVKVMELGLLPKSGVTVYMFDKGPGTFFTPFFADKTVVTESDGVATFELSSLDVLKNQTTFYFAVFSGDKYWYEGVTIKTKSVTISVSTVL